MSELSDLMATKVADMTPEKVKAIVFALREQRKNFCLSEATKATAPKKAPKKPAKAAEDLSLADLGEFSFD